MKEMVYKSSSAVEVLDSGKHKGIDYLIISYGTHPCTYIRVPKSHKYANADYDTVPLNVHGGLTYDGCLAHIKDEIGVSLPKGGYWLGWDYAHAGDFSGYYLTPSPYHDYFQTHDKKWTTAELHEQAIKAIEDFKKL